MRLTVPVTATDIERGERFHPERNPLALALRRHPGGGGQVWVGEGQASSGDRIALLPTDAMAFLDDFHAGRPVLPAVFELDLMWTDRFEPRVHGREDARAQILTPSFGNPATRSVACYPDPERPAADGRR